MIKLAFVTTGLSIGGAEKMLVKLLRHINRNQFSPQVYCLTDKQDLRTEIESLDIPVHVYELNKPLKLLTGLIKFLYHIKKFKPDLIQGWMYHGNIFAWLGSIITKSKLIFGIRVCLYDFNFENRLTQFFIRLGAKLSSKVDGTIYVSTVARTQHEAVGYSSKGAITIANGFELEKYKSNPNLRQEYREKLQIYSDIIAIGYFARFHKMKGFPYLIQAFATIHKNNPKTCLILAGHNVDEHNTEIKSLLKKYNLNKHVHLLGELMHPERVLPALDLFVSPSLQEGFPNVVGEAMACELPCVVTDVGDSALAVGDTGIVVPANNLHALSEAVLKMIEDPSKLQIHGMRARVRVENEFSLPHIVHKYEQAYQEYVMSK